MWMGSWMVSYGVMMAFFVAIFQWDVDLETSSDLWRPPVPYMDYFIPSILVAFAASSWGYLPLALGLPFTDSQGGGYFRWIEARVHTQNLRISTLISPQNAMTATVMFILVGCGILGNPYKILGSKWQTSAAVKDGEGRSAVAHLMGLDMVSMSIHFPDFVGICWYLYNFTKHCGVSASGTFQSPTDLGHL